MGARFQLILLLLMSLGGCAIPRPWLGPGTASGCPPPQRIEGEPLLLVSYRLPDCRRGPLEWTFFRSEEPQFGVADQSRTTRLVDPTDWWAELARQAGPARNAPVIFIHGYSSNEDDAVARSLGLRALLCPRDTKLKDILTCKPVRPVIALGWPSYGNLAKYPWDETNSEWTIGRAEELIVEIARQYPGAILVAHSMGNRILVAAAERAQLRAVTLGQLILASADVDREEVAALLRRPEGLGYHATIYGSRKDQALSTSWREHGYPRAGDLSNWVTGRKPAYPYLGFHNAEIVDTTNVKADLAGHRAFIASQEGAADLCHVLAGDKAKPGPDADPEHDGYHLLHAGLPPDDDCASRAWAAVQIADKHPEKIDRVLAKRRP